MSKMPRVAHGRPCRQAEMGVGSAHGPIYLRQMRSSGRRTSWRRSRQEREPTATRNCRWRFLALIVCACARRLPAWRANCPGSAIWIALSPSVSTCSFVLVIAGQRAPRMRPDDNLREAIQRGVGKADLLPRYARRIDGGVLASEPANGK